MAIPMRLGFLSLNLKRRRKIGVLTRRDSYKVYESVQRYPEDRIHNSPRLQDENVSEFLGSVQVPHLRTEATAKGGT